MGYLDRQSRVIDVVLTERGRKLYAASALDFSYFGLFDDCIDYDPVLPGGTFSDDDREVQVESTLILEAPFIKDVRGTTGPMEPTDHIFTAAGGFVQLPMMSSPADGSAIDLSSDQRRDGGTYRRTGTSLAQIDLDVSGDSEMGNPGFIVRVLSSGSNGLQPLGFRRDLAGRRAVDPFIAIALDDEQVLDRPMVVDPTTARTPSGIARK